MRKFSGALSTHGKEIFGSKILVLEIAYKPNGGQNEHSLSLWPHDWLAALLLPVILIIIALETYRGQERCFIMGR